MRARLIPIDGGDSVEIVKDLILVGRGEDCELRLDHKSVSKRHCVLVKTDGLVLIRDLGSTNGTRVNGQRVRRGTLLPNDVLSVANFRFTLQFGDGPSAASATESLGALSRSADGSDPEHEVLPPRADPVRRNTLPDDDPA